MHGRPERADHDRGKHEERHCEGVTELATVALPGANSSTPRKVVGSSFDSVQAAVHNRFVRSYRLLAVVCALLVPSAAIADDLIRFSLSYRAAACCAKTNGDCAGLSTPDTCCQTHRQAAGQGLTTIAPGLRSELAPPAVDPASPLAVAIVGVGRRIVPLGPEAFKRPHDPPHLHTFSLLI
jgi:hypothetical protein